EIRPGTAASGVGELTVFGDDVVFRADDGRTGLELWRSDGTAAGTRLVLDLAPGTAGSTPDALVAADGPRVYFRAFPGVSSSELWVSDGTVAGTRRILQSVAAPRAVEPQVSVGATLFFGRHDPTHGFEPWVTDGTFAGTRLLRDVHPGTQSSWPTLFSTPAGRVWFVALDPVQGAELWVSDGTTSGTRLVADIAAGVRDSAPRHVTPSPDGNLVAFSATDRVTGVEAWLSDGTPAGTLLLADLNRSIPGATASADPRTPVDRLGQLVFAAEDGVHQRELWRS